MILAERCGICGSSRWCGRPCKNAPKPATVINAVNNAAPSKAFEKIAEGLTEALAIAKGNAKPAATNARRQAKWREANPALNRERARKGMRKKRASEKSS